MDLLERQMQMDLLPDQEIHCCLNNVRTIYYPKIFQTPGESGLNKWELGSGVYPVERLSMADINNMVHASSQFVQTMDNNTEDRIRKTFGQFKEQYLTKYKKSIQ